MQAPHSERIFYLLVESSCSQRLSLIVGLVIFVVFLHGISLILRMPPSASGDLCILTEKLIL
jgi:hypothetical protein